MKNSKIPTAFLLNMIFFQIFSVTAFANSSWHWISERRPYDILPFVIVFTLLIEILFIKHFSGTKKIFVLSASVVIGNLLSFAAPYLFSYIIPGLYTFEELLEYTPFYIVGLFYLILTLIIEIPVVFLTLYYPEECENGKKIFLSVAAANTITTILTAITERIFCPGSW